MTIRFAAARNRSKLGQVISLSRSGAPAPLAANDNGFEAANDDTVVTEALRHFAEHGVSAARRASDKAMSAHASGDSESFDWWLSVCRVLDRRMADAVVVKASLAT